MKLIGNLALGLLIYLLGPLACLAQVECSPTDIENCKSGTLESSRRESSESTLSDTVLLRRTLMRT